MLLISWKPIALSDQEQDENTLKSLFIYNFTKYLEWPSSNNSKFIIAVYGKTEITKKLQGLLGTRKIGDKAIEIKAITSISTNEQYDIVFIAKNNNIKPAEIALVPNLKSTLIITEERSINTKYPSINIIEKEDKLRFQINETSLKKNGFKISRQLLELSETVK